MAGDGEEDQPRILGEHLELGLVLGPGPHTGPGLRAHLESGSPEKAKKGTKPPQQLFLHLILSLCTTTGRTSNLITDQ